MYLHEREYILRVDEWKGARCIILQFGQQFVAWQPF